MSLKKFLVSLFLAGAIVLAVRPSLPQREQSSVVLVETATGYGSAVTIKRGSRIFAWTAAHVVDKSAKVQVHKIYRSEGNKAGQYTCDAHVICVLPGVDAALLVIDGDPSQFSDAWFASDSPTKPGKKISGVGNVLGPKFDTSYTEGVVSQNGIRVDNEECLLDQANIAVAPGCSGGPLFNSHGRVIGLVVIYVGPGIALYVPNRVLEQAAEKAGVTWALHGFVHPLAEDIDAAIDAREKEIAKIPTDPLVLFFSIEPPGNK